MSRKPNFKGQSSLGIQAVAQGRQSVPIEEQIRRRAYEIYLARGAVPGDPMKDWLQAERELKGKLVRS